MVESDEVALIFSSLGTAHNTAIAKYLQSKNIPQLFIGSGASKFTDLTQYPQATLARATTISGKLPGSAIKPRRLFQTR